MILFLFFILSLVPSIALYLWLRGQKDMQEGYKERCKKVLIAGCLSIFPVVLCSMLLNIAGNLFIPREGHEVLYQVYYKFFVLAFSEELVKFLSMKKAAKGRSCSWLEYTIYMMIVGLGFEVMEAIPYAIDSGAPQMLVRGITMMHIGFGYIMGRLYGKYRYTGKKVYAVLGFAVPWFFHGLYDFTLSPEVLELNDNIAFIPVSIALACLILVFFFVRFVIKARNKEPYCLPIGAAA